MNLTFETLRLANLKRCPQFGHQVDEWSPTDWGNALAGEVGEACNYIKKLRRLAPIPEQIDKSFRKERKELTAEIAKELADVVCYADLLAARLDIDLGASVVAKFNEVSERIKSDVRLVAA